MTSAVNVLAHPSARVNELQAEQLQIAGRRRLQRKRVQLGKLDVPAYFTFTVSSLPGAMAGDMGSAEVARRLQELLESESVRYTLALAALLQKRAPWVLRFGKWTIRRLTPIYQRMR